MTTGLITLTTDFGYRDPFVGIMKGVILAINPSVRIVDLNHGLPPQDLLAAAFSLDASVRFFPKGTIHLGVVDPGVGSERRPLMIASEGHFFIGPDNGIFTLALEDREIDQIVELSSDKYHLKPTSSTFHGRDIFAPAAAHLSLGTSPEKLGKPVKEIKRLPWPQVIRTDQLIQGEIVYIDGFGNLITNVHEHDLRGLQSEHFTVSLGPLAVQGLAPSYTSGGEGGYAALINSWGLLEISLFKGNAHLRTGAKIGDRVHIRGGQEAPRDSIGQTQ